MKLPIALFGVLKPPLLFTALNIVRELGMTWDSMGINGNL